MFLPAALALFAIAQPAEKPKPLELRDGDRIVWLGSTLVEREQRYGYWETALHAAFPDKQFTLRNLGWSGDTVFGESRARFDFDKPDAGFKQLVDQTLELKPTVIFVSYGTNESFEGKEGLPKFEKGLNKLLDALAPSKARVVLFSPMQFERTASLPDTGQNSDMGAYRDATKRVAEQRRHQFADAYYEVGDLTSYMLGDVRKFHQKTYEKPLTDNGMHLTESGYSMTQVDFLLSMRVEGSTSVKPTEFEKLRQAVIAKNQLFFYRWRPQNETYLFGFRKHEQGRNAKEVAEFDPLVKKAEDEIDKLRKTLQK